MTYMQENKHVTKVISAYGIREIKSILEAIESPKIVLLTKMMRIQINKRPETVLQIF